MMRKGAVSPAARALRPDRFARGGTVQPVAVDDATRQPGRGEVRAHGEILRLPDGRFAARDLLPEPGAPSFGEPGARARWRRQLDRDTYGYAEGGRVSQGLRSPRANDLRAAEADRTALAADPAYEPPARAVARYDEPAGPAVPEQPLPTPPIPPRQRRAPRVSEADRLNQIALDLARGQRMGPLAPGAEQNIAAKMGHMPAGKAGLPMGATFQPERFATGGLVQAPRYGEHAPRWSFGAKPAPR